MTLTAAARAGRGPRSTSTRVAHNVGVLRRAVAPAGVWAVVKADGYGHGAVAVAAAASTPAATGCASR